MGVRLQGFRRHEVAQAAAGEVERKPVDIELGLTCQVDQNGRLTDIPGPGEIRLQQCQAIAFERFNPFPPGQGGVFDAP